MLASRTWLGLAVLACAVPAVADLAEVKGRGALRVLVVGVRSGDEFFAPAGAQRDLIAGRFTVTDSRKKLIAFTSEVFPTRNVVLTRRPHPVVRSIAQLREEKVGVFLGPPTSLAYGVRKGDGELLKALDDYIENLRRTPTWSRLVVKYFGETAPDVLKKARTESPSP